MIDDNTGLIPTDKGISFDDLKSEIELITKENNEVKDYKSIFTIKTANCWIEQAKLKPIPNMLFSELWFEGELCILFSDTNLGKSILAVQIGNSISRGESINGFELQASKQKILYFDFELSEKQFQNRYSIDFQNEYLFDDNFIRVEINPDSEIPEGVSFEEHLNESLYKSIIETGARVLIIDNLTYLKNGTETARDALPLMKQLKALKKKFDISILLLAHTPKRDMTKPINKNDLQGSKMLINFCDSSFSIGESTSDKNVRYIKQIKQRNTEQVYDAENIIVCQINKPTNFLQFEFLQFGSENEHLKQFSKKDKAKIIADVKELSKNGKTQREIVKELGISLGSVNKYLKK